MGLENIIKDIESTLVSVKTEKKRGQSYFIEAPYGYGKSHLLKLVEHHALRNNFAVVQITLDGYDRAFNHPPRYIHHIYESLTIPDLPMTGLGDLIPHLIRGSQRERLLNWASSPKYRWGIGYNIRSIAQSHNDSEYFYHRNVINCRDITRRGSGYYPFIYDRILTLSDLCQAIGLSGLVVLFDEVESIATLLRNILSRLRSYEILGQLTDSNSFPHCCFFFAITPDFNRQIEDWDYKYEYRYYHKIYTSGCEFMNKWMKDRPRLLKIDKINKDNNCTLCQKVKELHEYAFSWTAHDRINSTFIESYIEEAEKAALLQREIVTSFINILDICQQHPSCNPRKELSLPSKKEERSASNVNDHEPSYFYGMAHWAKVNNELEPWERKLIYAIGKYMTNRWIITERMSKQAERIHDSCIKHGFANVLENHQIPQGKSEYENVIDSILEGLTPRERDVIRLRFGLEEKLSHTLEQIGRRFNVSRERIRQIEVKALRKLRHPSRSRKMKDMLDSDHSLEDGYDNLLRAIFGENKK